MLDLVGAWDGIGSPRILVLGDLMLDRYCWGQAERVSPEGPALVLHAEAADTRPGGAASVAALLRGLDAQVSLVGVVGADADGRLLRQTLEQLGIDHEAVLDDPDRPTTVKQRFLGRAPHGWPCQLLRVDHELCEPLPAELEGRLGMALVRLLARHDAVLVADYGKGVCTSRLLAGLLSVARRRGLPVLVDPARTGDWDRYRQATLLAPNRAEAAWATGRTIQTPADAFAAGQLLCCRHDVEVVLVKLDEDGLALVRSQEPGRLFETRSRPVCDVTGAGDMVLAVAGLCQASGVRWDETAGLANVAAGLQVERLGVALLSRAEVRAELLLPGGPSAKVVSPERMVVLAQGYRQAGWQVVCSNGCFDLLHAGHVSHLDEAARLGDVLVVAVNSDASVRRLKGPGRPVVPQADRATLLAAVGCVDHVVLFDDDTPEALLRQIRPDVLAKGGTYTPEEVVGREVVQEYGGRVHVTGRVEGISTTRLLAALRGVPLPVRA